MSERDVGYDPSQDCVTEKLEAFVGGFVASYLGTPRTVCHRPTEQPRVVELVPKTVTERLEVVVGGVGLESFGRGGQSQLSRTRANT